MLTHERPACYRVRVTAKRVLKAVGIAAAAGVAVYGGYVILAWRRYGRPKPPSPGEVDPLLDEFMPDYHVVERQNIILDAPAELALRAACEMNLEDSRIVRILFKSRERILRAIPGAEATESGLITRMRMLGWGQLAERPGREIVMGAATQPWEANVVFRPIPPQGFAAFREKRFVKIAWTLRADPLSPTSCIFRTETRVVACGAYAYYRFRSYWAFLSPGIILIRLLMLRQLKRELRRPH
jgi:hypothetical protein